MVEIPMLSWLRRARAPFALHLLPEIDFKLILEKYMNEK